MESYLTLEYLKTSGMVLWNTTKVAQAWNGEQFSGDDEIDDYCYLHSLRGESVDLHVYTSSR